MLLADILQGRFMIQAGPSVQNELVRVAFESKKSEG